MSTHTNTNTTRRIGTQANENDEVSLANSTIVLEDGPAGTIARVDHDERPTEYAGPLPAATIAALREVSR